MKGRLHVPTLLLKSSKTSYKQHARIQHLKIENPLAVKILDFIYADALKEETIYAGSPGVYRKRWNYLLKSLGVPDSLRVTPGGLRGGGAVAAYRSGVGISDLVWRMRLCQISTLESYLQETAAVSLLTDLPSESRWAVRQASLFFPHLASG